MPNLVHGPPAPRGGGGQDSGMKMATVIFAPLSLLPEERRERGPVNGSCIGTAVITPSFENNIREAQPLPREPVTRVSVG